MATMAQDGRLAVPTGVRRTGWLLIGSFAAGIGLLALTIMGEGELAAREIALNTATFEATGRRPPVAELAALYAQYAPASISTLLADLLGLTPFVLFALAAAGHRRTIDASRTARIGWLCALGALALWALLLYMNFGLRFGPDRLPPLLGAYNVVVSPAATLVTWFGCCAVIGMGLAARRARVAPRTALAAVVVAALVLLIDIPLALSSNFIISLPPLVPLIPALLLGIGLLRVRAVV